MEINANPSSLTMSAESEAVASPFVNQETTKIDEIIENGEQVDTMAETEVIDAPAETFLVKNRGPNRAQRRKEEKENKRLISKWKRESEYDDATREELGKSSWDELVRTYEYLHKFIMLSAGVVLSFREEAEKENIDVGEFVSKYTNQLKHFNLNLNVINKDARELIADLEVIRNSHANKTGPAQTLDDAMSIIEIAEMYLSFKSRASGVLLPVSQHLTDILALCIEQRDRINALAAKNNDAVDAEFVEVE